jgi:hypothetical protein
MHFLLTVVLPLLTCSCCTYALTQLHSLTAVPLFDNPPRRETLTARISQGSSEDSAQKYCLSTPFIDIVIKHFLPASSDLAVS